HERRVPPDPRRPLQQYPRPREPGLPGRCAGGGRGPGRRDRALSSARAGSHAADLPARRGGLAVTRSRPRRLAFTVGHRAIIVFFTLFAIFPFYWMVVTSFKQNSDLYVGASNTQHNPFVFNQPPTLDHLRTLFGQTLYVTWLFNTLFVGVLVVAITLLLAV